MLSNLDNKLQHLDNDDSLESQIHEESLSTHKRITERSPENERLIKKITKQKMSVDDLKYQALYEIYTFYARQHIKRGITFSQQEDEQRIDKGELISFCKDFGIHLSKLAIHEAFKKVSPKQNPLVLQ